MRSTTLVSKANSHYVGGVPHGAGGGAKVLDVKQDSLEETNYHNVDQGHDPKHGYGQHLAHNSGHGGKGSNRKNHLKAPNHHSNGNSQMKVN